MSESINQERIRLFKELDKILKLGDLVRYESGHKAMAPKYGLVTQRNETAVFPGFWISWHDRKFCGTGVTSIHCTRAFDIGSFKVVR